MQVGALLVFDAALLVTWITTSPPRIHRVRIGNGTYAMLRCAGTTWSWLAALLAPKVIVTL